MPQTRMFRDRMVSMEQTLEGGEKNLELLKALCREAMPDYSYREHLLDHERDLFVMVLESPDGRAKRVSWTRMVLFDAERIPSLNGDPLSALRGKIVEFLRGRSSRPEIVVTFRHLEEGWVDSEPRREKRRRRRGDRGRREGRRETPAAAPPARPALEVSGQPQRAEPRRPPRAAAPGPAAVEGQRPPGGRRRRRNRRRRRRGGGPGPAGQSGPPPTP